MSFDPRSQSNIYKTEKYWPGQFCLGAGIIVLEKLVHIITKVYIPSNIKKSNEYCAFLFLDRLAVLKMSAVLLKYPTLWGGFHGKNKYKIRVSVHIL